MKWLDRLIEASRNPDKFWANYHLERRQKRLAYWRKEARKHELRYHASLRMVAYYEDVCGR